MLNTICSTFNCYRFTYYIIDIHSMPFNVTCISISWLQRFAWLNWFKWPQPSPDTLKAWKLKGENYWTKITGGVAKGGTPPSISSHWSSSSTFEIWINDSTNFGPWCTCEYLPPLKKNSWYDWLENMSYWKEKGYFPARWRLVFHGVYICLPHVTLSSQKRPEKPHGLKGRKTIQGKDIFFVDEIWLHLI